MIGWPKVLAAGSQEVSQNRNAQYVSTYEMRRDAPDRLGLPANFAPFSPPSEKWIEDRIACSGGQLTFTRLGDGRLKVLSAVIAVAEGLAGQHARLIDTNHAVRLQVDQLGMQFQRVADSDSVAWAAWSGSRLTGIAERSQADHGSA